MTHARRPTATLGTAAALVAATLALSGCSASVDRTLAADDVAELAADALAAEWSTDPAVDCGDDSVAAVEGTEVECGVFNPKSGLDYPATVTLTEIDGSQVTVSVDVGDAIIPDDADDAGDDGGAELGQTGDAPADAPTVQVADFAALAAGALETQLDYAPVLDCGTQPIAVAVGATVECLATADDGKRYPAHVVVTEVTESNYDIDVTMDAAPVD